MRVLVQHCRYVRTYHEYIFCVFRFFVIFENKIPKYVNTSTRTYHIRVPGIPWYKYVLFY